VRQDAALRASEAAIHAVRSISTAPMTAVQDKPAFRTYRSNDFFLVLSRPKPRERAWPTEHRNRARGV
jgi:hypothetical protein